VFAWLTLADVRLVYKLLQVRMNSLLKSWGCDTALNVMKVESVRFRIVFGLKSCAELCAYLRDGREEKG
jgi:hypothetical protein